MHQLGTVDQARQDKAAPEAAVALAEQILHARPTLGRHRQLVGVLGRHLGEKVTFEPRKVHPVDRPGCVFGGSVDVRHASRQDDGFTRGE